MIRGHGNWLLILIGTLTLACGGEENGEPTEMEPERQVMAPGQDMQPGTPSMMDMQNDLNEDPQPSNPGGESMLDPQQPGPEMEISPSDELAQRAYEWLQGTFDSTAQAASNPEFFAISLKMCPVNAPTLGDRVLYVEQASMSRLSAPYRQRLYVVSARPDNMVISEVYALVDDASAIGLCDRDEVATFTVNDVTERTGCAVELAWSGDSFIGGTVGNNCSSTLNGASYATSEVTMTADTILSWDRGFDAAGQQVWGSTAGAYQFLRTVEEPEPEPAPEMMPAPQDGDIPVFAGGETCVDAPKLTMLGQPLEDDESIYTTRMVGSFGQSNDYNPYRDSGLAPGCSLVYDAFGNDVVFEVSLNPGATIHIRLQMEVGRAGGMYFLDSCDNPSWPDLDGSTMCGRNEYRSHGNCDWDDCAPLEWSFTWPRAIDGVLTERRSLFLVIDQVIGADAELFQLDWVIREEG